MKVKEIMKTNVITAHEDESIREVTLRLREKKITGVPVLNDNGEVVGVFSETDLLNRLPDILNDADKIPLVDVKELTDPPVKTVMSSPAITVTPDTDIKDVAKIFLYKYIHRVPVLEGDKLVGIVSLGDLLKAFSES
ncbi:CBS domain-containing protein [Calditerrivibrio nitroreducens]|uniref:CBS domain containing membrane protein n=1 Tax=Calditerrivibrio nitroreducens (strain DSM 19672 / NBRC 101217 / Yu37-1) TaxID=768670 RepID=E4TH81_CALNY|nr:CBS domain-containing protein [Calditerrivibrio nitroreducens]ADR18775.1 CBS domain containing membrane protein [Calditerrivibrio nitroreducens DSM 19672]